MCANKTKVILGIIGILAIILPNASQGQWIREEISTNLGWVQESQVAEGRNDGQKRIYIASPGTMAIHEMTWTGTIWDRIEIGSSSFQMRDLYVGMGRNDDTMRVYTADDGLVLREHTWTGAAWDEDTVGGVNYMGVVVGAGRNDGIERVYASKPSGANDNYIYEYTWLGNAWGVDSVQGGTNWFYKPVLGKGRNDDTVRIYAPCFDVHIYEFTWNGSVWDVTDVGGPVRMNDITIGAGRDDGVNRLYAAGSDGHVYEHTWDGSNWTQTSDLLPAGGSFTREVHVGMGRGDGVIRLYCAGTGSGLTEYTWGGSDWQEDNMGTEIDGLTIGDGRDDLLMRVYAASMSAFAEYLYPLGVDENKKLTSNTPSLEVFPNPFREKTKIKYIIEDTRYRMQDLSLQIYDVNGQLVRQWDNQTIGLSNHIIWDGKDNVNRPLPSGVYFVKLETNNYKEMRQILLIK